MRLAAILAIALAGAPAMSQAAPQAQTEADRHKACIAKIDTDAKGAYEDALAWMTSSGDRPAARHCAALALIELGHPGEGAARLEELANAKDAGAIETRAVYLAQSGNAWLLARRPEAAIVTLSNALKLRPGDDELLKDRARAFMMQKEWEDAGADLDAANKIQPSDAETLRLRAGVLKELKRLPEAWSDVETAMAIAPTDVKVLVVRGDVREAMRLAGLPDPIDKQVTSQPDVVRPTIIGN
jgi:tetratricopeptide (TPR) repeat protein